MFTSSLIHLAVLAYFLVPSAHSGATGLSAAQKEAAKAHEKTKENIVLLERPFCEKCLMRSDVPSPLPKQITSYHWNLDQVALSSVSLPSTRMPAPYAYLTAEFDKRVANSCAIKDMEFRPVSQLLGDGQPMAADAVGSWEINVDVKHDDAISKVCLSSIENYLCRSSKIPALRIEVPQVWPDGKAPFNFPRRQSAYEESILSFNALSYFDPETCCLDPARFYCCRATEFFRSSPPMDPTFVNEVGRCNDVLNSNTSTP